MMIKLRIHQAPIYRAFNTLSNRTSISSRQSLHRMICSSAATDRDDHNKLQSDYFQRELRALQDSITDEVNVKLRKIADTVPGLSAESRILDVGAGDGALIPHLQSRGVKDVLAVDVCPAMIKELEKKFGVASTVGNEPGVRTWVGDVTDLPSYLGPFDAAFFNAVFGNLWDTRAALLKAVFLTKPGGYIVISHPLGRPWHARYRSANPAIVPHDLPDRNQLEQFIADFPLQIRSFKDDSDMYTALLQIPEGYALPQAPIYLSGNVINGFGRGSKQLGVPTANLPPEPLKEQLEKLPAGVYFGWARVDPAPGSPEGDGQVHKMVMNVGKRPTFEDKDPETSVELHIMHPYAEDFYGRQLKAVVLGHIRPEVKFNGLQELLARIHTDIGLARSQLDTDTWAGYKNDAFL